MVLSEALPCSGRLRIPAQSENPRRLTPALPFDEDKPSNRSVNLHSEHPRPPLFESDFEKVPPRKWPGLLRHARPRYAAAPWPTIAPPCTRAKVCFSGHLGKLMLVTSFLLRRAANLLKTVPDGGMRNAAAVREDILSSFQTLFTGRRPKTRSITSSASLAAHSSRYVLGLRLPSRSTMHRRNTDDLPHLPQGKRPRKLKIRGHNSEVYG
jgi:hypothetical protein